MVGGGTVDNLKGFHKGVGNGGKRKIKINNETKDYPGVVGILIVVVVVATAVLFLLEVFGK
tara:strand:+ start:4466 stop:4648 length:183 start_codon:yes stop_codon:yes gene_type:complete